MTSPRNFPLQSIPFRDAFFFLTSYHDDPFPPLFSIRNIGCFPPCLGIFPFRLYLWLDFAKGHSSFSVLSVVSPSSVFPPFFSPQFNCPFSPPEYLIRSPSFGPIQAWISHNPSFSQRPYFGGAFYFWLVFFGLCFFVFWLGLVFFCWGWGVGGFFLFFLGCCCFLAWLFFVFFFFFFFFVFFFVFFFLGFFCPRNSPWHTQPHFSPFYSSPAAVPHRSPLKFRLFLV